MTCYGMVVFEHLRVTEKLSAYEYIFLPVRPE